MKEWLIISFLFMVTLLKGQEPDSKQYTIDSLKQVINNTENPDSVRAKAILDMSYFYYLVNPDTTLLMCEQALELSTKSNYAYGLSESYGWLGYLLQNIGETKRALVYHRKSLLLAYKIHDLKGTAVAANNIAHVFGKQGAIEKALNYYSICLQCYEITENKAGVATVNYNIGALYDNQGEKDVAAEYYLRALKMAKELQDNRMISFAYNNLGYLYDDGNNDSLSFWYYTESIKLIEEVGDYQAQGNTLSNMAHILDRQGKREEAMLYFQRALEMQHKVNNTEGVIRTNVNIANVLYAEGLVQEAYEKVKHSYDQSIDLGYPRYISSSASLLSTIYADRSQYSEALKMYKIYIDMRDSLNNMENKKALVSQQAKYEYEKQKALDDAEHDKQLAIEQEAKAKQQILTYSTATGLGLVAVFLLFVFNRLKVTRKQKGVIELAHMQLETKNQEILDSINYAKRIQSAILPPEKVVKEYLQNSFIFYLPKDIVAGDFYWLEHVKGKVLFAAADCTGHGVPGAMVSVVCNNGLNRSVREHGLTDPGKILDKTREIVVQEFEKSEDEVKDGMDIALCSLEGKTMHYAGAHNPLWIIRNGADEIEEIKADKQPIGKTETPAPYKTHRVELEPGDRIYVFSDGYADQFGGEKGKKLKTVNFKKLLLSIKDENMQKQSELLKEAFENWKGELDQLDDICVIGVRI